jgi:outer membrane lipoprotein-sorting protein
VGLDGFIALMIDRTDVQIKRYEIMLANLTVTITVRLVQLRINEVQPYV